MHYKTSFCQKGHWAFGWALISFRRFPIILMHLSHRLALLSVSLALPVTALAQTSSFSDVPTTSPLSPAIEYLKSQGILQGYSDGTFRPEQTVTRAEAVKVVVAPLVSAEELATYTTTGFNDIPAGSWYLPFTEAAVKKLKAIDGPPAKPAFKGSNGVTLAEFLKIMEVANGINPATAYSEITSPIATDVVSNTDWFYAPVRYAITASMVIVNEDGTIQPGRTLTRSDVATLLYRFLMYQQGRRTQALLSETEGEIVNVLQLLDTKDIVQADLASTRALLAARGALASRPDEPIVKGAMKTAEGFRSLVSAFIAGSTGQYQQAVDLAGAAWNLANKAREFSPSLDSLAVQMQTVAKTMADEARKNLQ